ncbi:MAG: MFS transporter [Candidatus Electryonea clarkiae]|nr:MFS transporter [Candidatus Electryonea clarkiae]MDP8289286.1 MFS transporter [Candidatus Electryonea clarkiae]
MSETTTQIPDLNNKRWFFGFPWGYWMLNGIEMWERMAYFAVRSVVAVYIMQADDPNGLHFTAFQKGQIYAWWFVFQSVLPMITGGYADRYGYKKTLFFSVSMNIAGYILMAYMRSYWGFFFGVMVLATGTAFFKPSLQGSLAQNLTKKNSSVGWGIFYWVVNIGAFAGPFLAGYLRHEHSWRHLFIASAVITSLNYLMLFTFKDFPSGADKTLNPLQVFVRTMRNIFEPRLITWLLIMSCFWLMMYQLWDLHPNFLTDWNDSGSIADLFRKLPFIPDGWAIQTDRGLQVPQEYLLNVNAGFIILLMIPVAWMVRKLRTLEAMAIGMSVAMFGILVAGFTASGSVFVLGVILFSLGEMLTGPKKNEYLGLIAPPGKKALYLGYVNIPVGIGGWTGSILAGFVYGRWGEKAVLAQKYLLQHTPMGEGKTWSGNPDQLTELLNVTRTESFLKLQEVTGLDAVEATKMLWDLYNPQYYVWTPFAVIGFFAVIALIIFAKMAKRWSDMNA